MKPLASSVPRLLRASDTFASRLDFETQCEIRPPTKSGVLIWSGRYIPMANASGGMPIMNSRTESTSPTL